MTAPAKQLLLIGHDYLSAGPIEDRFVARGYDVESVQVIPPDRTDDPGVVYASGGATTVWVDFPAQKSVPLPDWFRKIIT